MARGTKKSKEMTLENVLWNCRVALRGIGSTEKNRDAVIFLVFLKFAGDKFEKRYEELKQQYGFNEGLFNVVKEKTSSYNAVNVFYLNETSRWSYIVAHAGDNDIAVILDTAMADIEKMNPSLQGALSSRDKDGNPVYTFFATLGATTAKLKDLIDNVNQIDANRFHEEDLIGRVYEYFLQAYAASGTKEDGEFYTPSCAVKLIAELIEPYSGVVYDPCCGNGGIFVQSMKFVDRNQGNRQQISIIGQESNVDTWRLCKMNLAIRGIAHNLGEKNASTFTEDLHKDKKVDYVMASPPFNLENWCTEKELTNEPRFKGYGEIMPPVANANYAWIEHIISNMGITFEEKAFYDILVKVRDDHDFPYADEKCIVLAKKIKELVDDKARFADWSVRDDIKNQLNMDLTVLLYENGYPPEWDEEVFEKVMAQAENFKKNEG